MLRNRALIKMSTLVNMALMANGAHRHRENTSSRSSGSRSSRVNGVYLYGTTTCLPVACCSLSIRIQWAILVHTKTHAHNTLSTYTEYKHSRVQGQANVLSYSTYIRSVDFTSWTRLPH